MMGGMVGATTLPPPFAPSALLTEWRLAPWVVLPVVAGLAAYWAGVRRVARTGGRPWPASRTWWATLGAVTLLVALASPVDAYAEVRLSVHMVQHVLLSFVAAPLIVLAAPVTLALRTLRRPGRRRRLAAVLHHPVVRAMTAPVTAWSLFVAAQVAIHFTPFYEAALEGSWVHAAEHAVFLGTALLFWAPVVAADPVGRGMGFPSRLLYLAMAIVVTGFVTLPLLAAPDPLYGWYADLPAPWGAAALTDQRTAAAVMWVVGSLVLLAALLVVASAWRRDDEERQRRAEVREDAGMERSGRGS
jgi:putative copper resistance protein D